MAETVTPQASEYDGRHVTYIDRLLMRHAGWIVGESPDGLTYYAQSDDTDLKPVNWDFTISKRMIEKVLDPE